ncbi:MAG TPA: alpha/beta fold hydrolase [Bryobacteraceae bacterium]|nr:alpha/beta fold hydrolase [Bryobacteraceae bacterium]
MSIAAADGAKLSAWWLRAPQPNGRCVVVLHGIADSRVGSSGFAPMFLGEGYSVLLPDSRAHGESGGEFVTYGLLERYDAIAWARWMRQAGCGKLYALGESLGASVLIESAAIEPVFAAIVAESAYADLRETAEYRLQRVAANMSAPVARALAKTVVRSGVFYAKWVDGLDILRVSPLDAIARAQTPILLIHGLRDDETPPVNSEKLAKANAHDVLWLVPGAVHVGAAAAAPEEFRRRVLGWFRDH